MSWIQFIIETTQNRAEHCSTSLMDANAVAVTFEDAKDTPLFEPAPDTEPLWNHTRVIGLFESMVDVNEVQAYLKEHLEPEELSSLKIEPLEDKDWVTATNRTEMIGFGHNFWIIPSHLATEKLQDPAKNNNATYVILDAGLAFGTGTHPTTALCLKWLAAHPPKERTVLDYGCGSGILGIAAKKLGAKQVFAIDYDPQALYSTKMNAEKNGISLSSLVTLSPETIPSGLQVDLIVANILAEPLMTLAERFSEMLPSGGKLILSGILKHQISTLEEHYAIWFTDFIRLTEEEWACIEATRK